MTAEPSVRLGKLVERIKSELHSLQSSQTKHQIRIGLLLIEAGSILPDDEWKPWCAANFPTVGESTLRRWKSEAAKIKAAQDAEREAAKAKREADKAAKAKAASKLAKAQALYNDPACSEGERDNIESLFPNIVKMDRKRAETAPEIVTKDDVTLDKLSDTPEIVTIFEAFNLTDYERYILSTVTPEALFAGFSALADDKKLAVLGLIGANENQTEERGKKAA